MILEIISYLLKIMLILKIIMIRDCHYNQGSLILKRSWSGITDTEDNRDLWSYLHKRLLILKIMVIISTIDILAIKCIFIIKWILNDRIFELETGIYIRPWCNSNDQFKQIYFCNTSSAHLSLCILLSFTDEQKGVL